MFRLNVVICTELHFWIFATDLKITGILKEQ